MKSQWLIQGAGGQSVIDEGGSKRCQLTLTKWMLWNERNNLLNAEIIGLIKMGTASTNAVGGFLLRCDSSCNNAYYLRITSAAGGATKQYFIYRILAGVWTLLTSSLSSESPTVYTKVRFRVDGNQISVEEYITGTWTLIQLVTDNYITTTGYAGLRGDSGSGYTILFDDIQINEKA